MPYADPERHKQYHKNYQKQWYKDNPDKQARKARKYHQTEKGRAVKRRSVLKTICWTPEEWDKAYTEQGGVCAICGQVSTDGRKLSADHDHKKKKARGLLCNECNFMLGKARDNPDILEAGADYLRKYSDA